MARRKLRDDEVIGWNPVQPDWMNEGPIERPDSKKGKRKGTLDNGFFL